jgi:hypothetical protein
MATEKDIVHENGTFWVLREAKRYLVMKNGATHSVSDSAYPRTVSGLSVAIARCDYLATGKVNTRAALEKAAKQ